MRVQDLLTRHKGMVATYLQQHYEEVCIAALVAGLASARVTGPQSCTPTLRGLATRMSAADVQLGAVLQSLPALITVRELRDETAVPQGEPLRSCRSACQKQQTEPYSCGSNADF